jgi:ribosomal protein L14E/L6E/L27E
VNKSLSIGIQKEPCKKIAMQKLMLVKKNLKRQYKVFNETVEKKNEAQQHFSHF